MRSPMHCKSRKARLAPQILHMELPGNSPGWLPAIIVRFAGAVNSGCTGRAGSPLMQEIIKNTTIRLRTEGSDKISEMLIRALRRSPSVPPYGLGIASKVREFSLQAFSLALRL